MNDAILNIDFRLDLSFHNARLGPIITAYFFTNTVQQQQQQK